MGRILAGCLLLSFLGGAIFPIIILIKGVPKAGIEFRDFKEKDYATIRNLSNEQAVEYVNKNVKMRVLKSWERITYIFESSHLTIIYRRTASEAFLILLLCSLSYSFARFKYKQININKNK